ncbi:mucin-5AC-like isoform X3 [Halichondria panicea]|uniref:mucin-5AC-like isoform X3 n=1 Tax=Halichondria panicea TaxID=6063 RepID=UPI00312B5113
MAKLTDIWKPRETLRDWGKTEYKIVRNWTPRAPPPTSPPDTTGPEDSPVKLNLSTTLRSFRGNQRINRNKDANYELNYEDHASETDSDGETISSSSHKTRSSGSVHTKSKSRALTKSRVRVDHTDIVRQVPNNEDPVPNSRETSESFLTRGIAPSSSTRHKSKDTILTGLELTISRRGSKNQLITDEPLMVQSSNNMVISKAKSTTKRRKRTSRVSYPRKKAAVKKNKSAVVELEQNDSEVIDPASTGIDHELSDSRTSKVNDVESETIAAAAAVLGEQLKGGTQPSRKKTLKISKVIQSKTVEQDESDFYEIVDNESDLKSKTATESTSRNTSKKVPTKRKTSASKRLTMPKRLTSKSTETAHQATNGGRNPTDDSDSGNERVVPTVDHLTSSLEGCCQTFDGGAKKRRLRMLDNGGVSDSSGGDENGTQHMNVTGGAPQSRKKYASLHTHLWQPRRVKRGKKDFSELDVCLNVYEDAIQQVVESCSNQTVSMAMVAHWNYTRKEILNLIKNSFYTSELQKLKKKEKLKQKGLERKMATVLTNLRKAHGKYQESLSPAKQAKKIEQEVSVEEEELNSVASGPRTVWQAQQNVEH